MEAPAQRLRRGGREAIILSKMVPEYTLVYFSGGGRSAMSRSAHFRRGVAWLRPTHTARDVIRRPNSFSPGQVFGTASATRSRALSHCDRIQHPSSFLCAVPDILRTKGEVRRTGAVCQPSCGRAQCPLFTLLFKYIISCICLSIGVK